MVAYIIRRLVFTGLIAFLAVSAVFFIIRMTGDPTYLMVPMDASQAVIDNFRHKMGFDKPLFFQYLDYIWNFVHGDLGTSLRYNEPALDLVLEALPATALLTFSAMAMSILIGIPLGIITGIRSGGIDRLITALVVLAQGVPNFWLGLMMIFIFSVKFHLLPTGGTGSIKHLIMPTIVLGFYTTSRITRLTKSSVSEHFQKEYIQTARAKGLRESTVLLKHCVRNALMPVVTLVGLSIGVYMGGVVITETIFSWPGMGRLIVQSIEMRDFPVVIAAVSFIVVVFSFINLITDIAYAWIDPRIRYD
ncbi:MAG: ABC transporter permease [Deltaproteobacteria bacterium]|nr:ABC transporter permease [Deltaproteobacteria bacterium]MBW2151258.1 ABC transporter permease [Deltaproteobacteria bacterium]